jgi:uncharacterized protein (DUF58 family)
LADPSGLLDPEFMRELEVLRRRLRIDVRSGASGEHVARRRGGSAEFHEHRPYAPGDDLRRVDWLAFARTGEPVLKLFRAEEDALLRLILDASGSLGFGDPPKLEVARRIAAAIGYLALVSGRRAQVLVSRSSTERPHGLEATGDPRRGRGALSALLRELAAPAASGTTDLARAIQETVHRSRRPGLLVLLSDFFDSGPVLHALSAARAAGHEVALVQVLARAELEPDFAGDFELVDAETSSSVNISVDPSAIEAYVLRVTGLIEELRGWARKYGASYVRITTDEPLQGAVTRFVQRAID